MQGFLRIVKVALLVNLFISLVAGVSASFAEREALYFIYIVILLFGSLFFPLIIASALHYFVRKKTGYKASILSLFLYSSVLFASIQLIFLFWSMIEVVWDFRLQDVVKHYSHEFGKMLWITVFIAVAIPSVYFIQDNQNKLKRSKS